MLPLTRLVGSLRSCGVAASKRTTSSSIKSVSSSGKSSASKSLAAKYVRQSQKVDLSSRPYCSGSPFAQPSLTHEQLPRAHHTVRPLGPDGFPRAAPPQLFQDFHEGVHGVLLDVRPASEFATWHVLGSLNYPGATFVPEDISDYPIDRPAYIVTGGNTSDMPDTLKVAKALKDLGAHVTIVEYGMKSFPDAGFLYYMDVDAEEARVAAIAAAEAAAAAAARK